MRVIRRLHGPPRTLAGELLRTALVDRLADRWDVAVTTVVAGPGFGKSTVLAQAIRQHAVRPRGIESWVTCEPGDEDARRLSAAICHAFGVYTPVAGPLDAAVEALRACSPIESCLILDDLHELPPGSSGQRLVTDLVARLPAGAHLVLCGRRTPAVPLARLHAADQVRRLGQADLAFSGPELDVIAGRAGRPVAEVAGLGGWPALVRLTLAAPAGVARDFLWEEVVSALTATEREVLAGLAVLGAADAATLTALAGVPADLDALAVRVPLVSRFVSRSGEQEARAHPLWSDALVRVLPAGRVAELRTRAAGLLLDRGDALRAGTIALAAGDADLLDRAATALVAETLATFPRDTGERWLAAAPAAGRGRPGLLLLAAATRYADRAGDVGVDELLDAAEAAARQAGDADAETAAVCLATIAAHARGDENRLVELYQRAIELPGADRLPTLRMLISGVRAAMFELFGSLDEALAMVESMSPDDVGQQPGKVVVRFHVYLLLLAGRADEAAEVAQRHLSDAPYAHVRRMPSFALWMAGRPAELLRERGRPDPLHLPEADANDRYRFNFLAFAAVVAASIGDRVALRHSADQLDASGLGADTRDAAMLATAAAAKAILDGDEPAARAAIEEFVADHPLDDPVASVHLRRFLAYGYVLSPECRRRWDADPLGPAHERVRAAARLLVAARAGRLTAIDPVTPETILVAYPLPWSAELAAHAEAAGLPAGRRLVRWLADHVGPAVHEVLRVLAEEPGTATAARRLLAAVPATPAARTRIEVLGPLRLLVDGVAAHPPQLRRRRVRELLALLALHGELDRARATDLLWPGLDPPAAARNLRVTLAYLRRVLEPGQLSGDRDRIRLSVSPTLQVDLAELREHLDEARRANARGEPAAAGLDLAAAVDLWRGEPLADLSGIPALVAPRTAILAELTEAALTLGERRLAEGATAAARDLAERVLAAEPYAERALRLVLAAETQRRDPAALDDAIRRVRDALAALGLPPEPATQVVLRQAHLTAGGARGLRPAR